MVSASIAIASSNPPQHFVTFPTKEVLRESFCRAGLDHFVEKIKIENIVDDRLVPLGVAVRLECALYDYAEDFKKGGGMPVQRVRMMETMMQMRNLNFLKYCYKQIL